jgi:hypothetical protein
LTMGESWNVLFALSVRSCWWGKTLIWWICSYRRRDVCNVYSLFAVICLVKRSIHS